MIVFCIIASSYIMRLYCRFALFGGEKREKNQRVFTNYTKMRLNRTLINLTLSQQKLAMSTTLTRQQKLAMPTQLTHSRLNKSVLP
jgi:hypothetical protein